MHFGDFDPTRPGREVFSVKEDPNVPVQVAYRDAATGDLVWGWFNARDTGRGLIDTTDPTTHRIATLMHDPVYRLAVAWQNNSYNQPPHPSFFIGNNMPEAPLPNIFVDPVPTLVGDFNGDHYASPVDLVLAVNRSRALANQYRVGNGTWTVYDGPVSFDEDGDYTVEFRTLGPDGNVLASASIAFTIELPVPGDLNGDGIVDRHDRKIVQQARGTCPGDPGFVAEADYDNDGCVTQNDFKIWTRLFVDYKKANRGR